MFDALLAEGAYAVIKNKRKQFYLNFLQDITNDINMPAHTRTEIWTIISALEGIRERHK